MPRDRLSRASLSRPLALAAALAACTAFAQPAVAKEGSCSAVSFKPFAGPMTTEPVTSGHYKFKFGSFDLMGANENGQPNYHARVNGKPLTPIKGDIPKSAYACLNSHHIKTPPQPINGPCNGPRFRIAVEKTAHAPLLMLFALKGDDWLLCEAGTPAQ